MGEIRYQGVEERRNLNSAGANSQPQCRGYIRGPLRNTSVVGYDQSTVAGANHIPITVQCEDIRTSGFVCMCSRR